MQAQESIQYTVKRGDSLMTISNQFYGTHQCYHQILIANPELKNKDELEVGQVVQVPSKKDCTKTFTKQGRPLEFLAGSVDKVKKIYLNNTQIPEVVVQKQESRGALPDIIRRKGSIATNQRAIASIEKKFWVQLKAAKTMDEAKAVCEGSSLYGQPCRVYKFRAPASGETTWHRVRLGPFDSSQEARDFFDSVSQDLKASYKDAFIVSE